MNTTKIFQNCYAQLDGIKTKYNIQDVYFGTGSDILKPCIIVTYKDAYQGECGYNVFVYPTGQGFNKEYKYYSITYKS